jgi:hypothetical protein
MSYASLIHEPVLIGHIHLLQILQIMYNKCVWKKINFSWHTLLTKGVRTNPFSTMTMVRYFHPHCRNFSPNNKCYTILTNFCFQDSSISLLLF